MLLEGLPIEQILGPTDRPIAMICSNSDQATQDSCFIALPGTQVDGHSYIPMAISAGSTAIVCTMLPADLTDQATYIVVASTAKALAIMAANFYDQPSNKLKIVAVTGTNGKTTIVHLLHRMALQMGYKAGMLSTIGNKVVCQSYPATHTTPDAIQLHHLFHLMVTAGCSYCFMEASSHAIVQERLYGVTFTGVVFTNITPEHLDYHIDFRHYIQAKKKLFDGLSAHAFALVNQQDKNHAIMLQNCKAQLYTFSLEHEADFRGKIISHTLQGMELAIDHQSIWIQLIGAFNASNSLAAYGVARLLGFSSQESLVALSAIPPIAGRMQVIQLNQQPLVVIDYAHTPDAIEQVITTLRNLFTSPRRLITIMGCGGNRDKQKRALIGHILAKYSEIAIFTSDNPRYENPQTIMDEMQQGVSATTASKVVHIVDRAMAIKAACLLANPDDLLLIAGKGHQHYEEINATKYDFCEEKIVRAIFENKCKL